MTCDEVDLVQAHVATHLDKMLAQQIKEVTNIYRRERKRKIEHKSHFNIRNLGGADSEIMKILNISKPSYFLLNPHHMKTRLSIGSFIGSCLFISTVCPRSLDPFSVLRIRIHSILNCRIRPYQKPAKIIEKISIYKNLIIFLP